MKFLVIVSLFITLSTYAHEESNKSHSSGVESMVKKVKKERRKKAQMCHECGKPEAQCECEGEGHREESH